jgi:hypothetical protein
MSAGGYPVTPGGGYNARAQALPEPSRACGVTGGNRDVRCAYCGKCDDDPEWGVLWSKQLEAWCCFRCYQSEAGGT